MKILKIVGNLVLVSMLTACATITANPGSENVEIVSVEQIDGDWGEECSRITDVSAEVGPNPSTESTGTPSEVEARNKAHEVGATHVAVERRESFLCNLAGNRSPEAEQTCYYLPATAYDCG